MSDPFLLGDRLDLETLSALDAADLEKTLDTLIANKSVNRADFWVPYPKQREFIAMGKVRDERLLMAGNQEGKSDTGADEMGFHLTGLYPEWWPGRVWRRPTTFWAAGVNAATVRDVQQEKLCGNHMIAGALGTGFIPKHCLLDHTLGRAGAAGAFDTLTVQHHTDGIPDGTSMLQFKAYAQGQMSFQGRTNDGVWWDEEPEDMGIYTEGNARWSATGGMSWMTFTPWHGRTAIVNRFMEEESELRGYVKMGVKDALHMTPKLIESLLSKYPKHEWPARIEGDPALGAGAIFTTDPATITFPVDTEIPPYFRKIWGIDFGGAGGGSAHPFAASLLAVDPDTDEKFICAVYKKLGGLPMVHADAMRRICSDAPVAWPHDGNEVTRGDGDNLMPLYKQFDLKMLPSHAHYPGGGYSTEAAVMDMQQGFERAGGPGGLKVREDLHEFFAEYRQYHRVINRNGSSVIVKKNDDLISATQKAIMMRRYALPVSFGWHPRGVRGRSGGRPTSTPPCDPWTGAPI